jgi:hypothetical protein
MNRRAGRALIGVGAGVALNRLVMLGSRGGQGPAVIFGKNLLRVNVLGGRGGRNAPATLIGASALEVSITFI